MEAIILFKSDLEAIKNSLQEVKELLKNMDAPSEHFFSKEEFVKLMGISDRTAQIWRDEGKIGFSQKGKKIYHRTSDIEKFLEKYYKAPLDELNKVNKIKQEKQGKFDKR